MYVGLRTFGSLHKNPAAAGRGYAELRRIHLPRTPVNKGKKRKGPDKRAGVLTHRLSVITCSYLPAGRAAALTVIARHHRGVGRVPLVRGGTAAPLRARLGLLGERYAPERHRQRQHQRREQQRNALPHLFSPPFLLSKNKTGPPLVR